MRILFINTLSEQFGSTVRCHHFVRCLRESGNEVLYSEAKPSSFDSHLLVEQKDTIISYIAATFNRMQMIRKQEAIDLVYLSKINPLVLPLIRSVKRLHIPLIVDWDDLDSWFQTGRLRTYITRLIEHWAPRAIPVITTHNHELKFLAEKRGCSHVVLIPQIVDTDLFDPSNYSKEEQKRRLGFSHNRFYISMVLTLTEGGARDLSVVLEAFSIIEKKGIPVSLIIIGDGPHKAKYQTYARELGLANIIWQGWLSYDSIPQYLSMCDLGIVLMSNDPGNYYRFSLKILEYMAMNIPVIGHITGATSHVFNEMMVAQVNAEPSCLADAIANWYFEFSKGPQTVQGNLPTRNYIIENHSLATMKSKLDELLNNII